MGADRADRRRLHQHAAAQGLATGFGDTATVGIGGITPGGGVGYLLRKHGLTIDNLLAAEVATADSQLRRVDADTHPDLFWALRGGGGNVGVATRFHYRLHQVDTVVGGLLVLPATPQVIASFIAQADAAPQQLSTTATIMPTPPLPFIPPQHHGQLCVLAMLVHAGDAEAGELAVAPFRALATPIADLVAPMPYPAVYPPHDQDYHPPSRRSAPSPTPIAHDHTTETILNALQTCTAATAVTQLRVLGSAIARVPPDTTAFAHRKQRIMVTIAALHHHPDHAPEHTAWASNHTAALPPSRAAHVGFLSDQGQARVHDAYPQPTWNQLAAIKQHYDPTNLFHLNQNITPHTAQLR